MHLDLAFKFYSSSTTCTACRGRRTYVNRLDVSAKMSVMGGERDFAASRLFATDFFCEAISWFVCMSVAPMMCLPLPPMTM